MLRRSLNPVIRSPQPFEIQVQSPGIADRCGRMLWRSWALKPESPARGAPCQRRGGGARRCVSIDGDADRVVYFTLGAPRVQLFDGDR